MPHNYLQLRAAEVAVHLGDAGRKLLRIQIFPISDAPLKHPAYGELKFDRAFAERVVANFQSYGGAVTGDYDHGTDDPRSPEQGVSAGVVRAVKIEGDAVYAYLEPTPRALRYVEDGEYRLASPTVALDWTNPTTGEKQGPTLLAVALTNRPFIRGMEPVAAVDADQVALRAQEDQMSEPKTGAETISLADHNAEVKALRDTNAALNASLNEIKARLTAVEAERDQLAAEKMKAAALADVEALEKEGKATPAMRESLLKFRASAPEAFAEYAKSLPVIVPLAERGVTTTNPAVQADDPQRRGLALSQRAEQLVAEKKARDYREALRLAKAELGVESKGLD